MSDETLHEYVRTQLPGLPEQLVLKIGSEFAYLRNLMPDSVDATDEQKRALTRFLAHTVIAAAQRMDSTNPLLQIAGTTEQVNPERFARAKLLAAEGGAQLAAGILVEVMLDFYR